ncbi:hypothetical protein [Macrococcus capreoli]|uniref:hypothetical protein n=1 Tax=Macrococcus capreoli TaxID=2982690 RepID=UPI0021D5A5D3|nr:hypothetical protein [Macrococcus sp. TMW 2.2395]MCU7556148.1 hypothetical protein [Macrococcus sp. TMW 2.2395]
MKKFIALFAILSVLLSGCFGAEDKQEQDTLKKEVAKKDNHKSEDAKKKIKENKMKKEKSTTESPTTEAPQTEMATTEMPTTEVPSTEVTTEAPVQTTEVATQEGQNGQQSLVDFCRNVRGEIPEGCITLAIAEAGRQKVELEQQASAEFNAGTITQEQYNQKLQEASQVMNNAWSQAYGTTLNQ